MKNITRDNLTDAVKNSFANIDDERLRHLVNRLAHHLHAFATETQLTHEEWREGIGFLHRAAEISSPSRSEFTLLSDVLGLSSLVDLLAARPGATEGSVLGPFHTRGSPWMDNGANLIRDNPGEAVLIRGRVTDIHGQPLPEASIDFWQNADNGMYWQMDDSQPQDNLRCQIKVQADGCFELATIRPRPYLVPTDGPVGELLRISHRDAWRPAHYHVIVEAPGYRSLITEVFDAADPWLDKDAVFGVRASLVCDFQSESDTATAARLGLPPQYLAIDLPIRLARGD
ncbi:dioxygenase family protein [Limnohabitans radicicola]|uniref:Hydroxyquinol 1,2-dioxygenase n=1 Tax=Limnohabitans radicicola TaxID=2771427 RepID=A0A927FJ22_9BURK|nr:dioxygenase [Limnohabitans radicicola]MBD8050968.1 hydroxyquinol 1,2-dioxygenase [Limnohabitans radicicola]